MTLAESIADKPAVKVQGRPDNDPPLISVVIPVKNDARRLGVCLRSLQGQAFPRDCFEVIVVDNGSTDESAAVAESLGACVLCEPGLRVGALRNRGVAFSRGSILAFVDSDHELPSDWLTMGVNALNSPDRPCAAGAHYCAPRNSTWVARHWELHRLKSALRANVDWLGAGNLFVQRDAFEAVRGFREDLVAAEDVDLCLRLQAQGGTILGDPAIRNIHHGEPTTLWQFCRKEYWRGSSGVRAFLAQGCPLRELPSLLFPAYHLVAAVAALVAIVFAVMGGSWLWPAGALALLIAPAFLLALHTGRRNRAFGAVVPLTVLYLAYGLTRAVALFKP